MQIIRLFALSGSLRATSRNTALLQAAQALAPRHIQIELYTQLDQIPPFNPDLNPDEHTAVAQLKNSIQHANGILIASPEYAHGVSGVLKNALDWLMGTDAFVNKPLAMFNAAPRAHHAYDALKETLYLMSVHWIEPASITVPVIGGIDTCADILADTTLSRSISQALEQFYLNCIHHQSPSRQ